MKKILTWAAVILIFIIGIKLSLRKDIPEVYPKNIPSSEIEDIIYPQKPKSVKIDGVDYLQSQADIGKFGGELIISTIGEGPKTFNPCNTKDATSASMAGILFDGLLTTDAITGEVIPLMAKSFEIKGNDYIITLRKGLKWTDGKPITADDIMYTYEDIVFKGLGNTATRDAMMIKGKLPELFKVDDYTVKFTTPEPFAPFLRQLTYPIVPKHYFFVLH